MKTITVKLPQGSYNIFIGKSIIGQAGKIIEKHLGKRNYVILSDENVWNVYGKILEKSLEGFSDKGSKIIVKAGEKSKSLETFEQVSLKIAEQNYNRDTLMIALGGGVVGDLAGFVASVYKRGIPLVQIPTSLIAQVDSSVGGKTALNLSYGKNLIGAFHQPSLVLMDPEALKTLDEKHISEGMAEVIKYGAALDKDFFKLLEEGADFEEIVYRSASIKRDVVEVDEKDTGERRKLNFGHSFGHGIEKMGKYEKYSHGQAVAMGMVLASLVGESLGLTEAGTASQLKRLLEEYRLETVLPDVIKGNLNEMVKIMEGDKKNQQGKLKLILLEKLGTSFIHDIEAKELLKLMESMNL